MTQKPGFLRLGSDPYVRLLSAFAALGAGYGRFPRASPAWSQATERLPFIDRALRDLPGAPRGTILFQRPHPNPIFQAEKLAWNRSRPPAFGAELKRRMREFFHPSGTKPHLASSIVLGA